MTHGGVLVAIVLFAVGAGGVAHSLEIEQADTKFRDRQYQLTLVAVVNAPQEKVERVLRDYASYPRLDPRILEANVLGRPVEHELLLYTKLRACVGVICRTVKRVERVQEREHEMIASVIPEQSEATSGETNTLLTSLGARTRISYTTRISPGFWVPSVIGRPLMLRTMREASIDLFRRIEQQAQTLQ